MNKFISIVAAAVVATSFGAVANAASVKPTYVCGDGDVYLTKLDDVLQDPSIEYTDCFGPIEGNDVGDKGTLLTNLASKWGTYGEWHILGKSDDAGSGVTAVEEVSGMFSAMFESAVSIFSVTVKAGSEYSAYLFDLRPESVVKAMGFFSTYNEKDLSHMTVAYVKGDTPVIPLPAAGWMLLAGVGGLAAMRRRKKAA